MLVAFEYQVRYSIPRERGVFIAVSHAHILMGRGPALPNFWGLQHTLTWCDTQQPNICKETKLGYG